ncbi:hypothetical protein GCM10009564_14990 [Streptomyces thermogriseus]|uniref:Uncharacterized protein n=1 Tax=Streptomyces thermogriseus TaxID=75292 RepID=A0ABN1SVN2_9ACTN
MRRFSHGCAAPCEAPRAGAGAGRATAAAAAADAVRPASGTTGPRRRTRTVVHSGNAASNRENTIPAKIDGPLSTGVPFPFPDVFRTLPGRFPHAPAGEIGTPGRRPGRPR